MEAVLSFPRTDIVSSGNANRKAIYIAEITKAMQARKEKRLHEALTRDQLGALSSSDRIVALKHGLLDNYRVLYATFPNMDVLPGVVLFVSVFSDNGAGCCTYAMARMARYFSRSERAIRDALHRAVDCGTLCRDKPAGGKYSHWPVVFRSILDPASSPTWFVDASLPVEMDTGSLLPVRRADTPEATFRDHRKPDARDHRKPDGNVFPTEDFLGGGSPRRFLFPDQAAPASVEERRGGRGEAAYAEANIAISPSGKLSLGSDLRSDLLKTYTAEVVDAAVECTLAAMGTDRNKIRIMQQIRRQCVFRNQDASKAKRTPVNQGVKTFQR
jgi:hypothetical protein